MRRRQRRLGRWLVAAVAVGLALPTAGAARRTAPAAPAGTRHLVRAGDTLWGLASRIEAPRYDRRLVVQLLQDINDLDTATLYPGQELVLPFGPAAVRQALRDPRGFAVRVKTNSPSRGQTPIATPSRS